MVTPPRTLDKANKVVVAYLDGRRLKGYVYDFSAIKDRFRLFPAEDPLHHEGTEIDVKDLKAVFFVKDFAGRPDYHESQLAQPAMHGRKIEVTFSDGEHMVGTTEGYNPQRLGFFIFPLDAQSNNARIFVVNKNVRQVKWA
jgi:hypothetical protein